MSMGFYRRLREQSSCNRFGCKAELHQRILQLVKRRGYRARKLERILRIQQPRVSELMRGKLSTLGVARLLLDADLWSFLNQNDAVCILPSHLCARDRAKMGYPFSRSVVEGQCQKLDMHQRSQNGTRLDIDADID